MNHPSPWMKQNHLQDKTAFNTEKALSISPRLNANVPPQFFHSTFFHYLAFHFPFFQRSLCMEIPCINYKSPFSL